MISTKHLLRWWSVLAFAGLAVALWLLSCSDDRPTGPIPHEPKDYRVWFWDSVSGRLFAYHTATMISDSMFIPWSPTEGVAASHDGRLLYLAQQSSVIVVDTDSLKLLNSLPFGSHHGVVVSPDGTHIAILGDDTWLLRTSDYSVVHLDTARSHFARFSADGSRLYGSDKGVRRMSVSDLTAPITRTQFEGLGVNEIVPTPDESKWLLYMKVDRYYGYAFAAYDCKADSIVFSEFLTPGVGDTAITPDGRWAFYGNPGSEMTGPPPASDFRIFDILNNRIEQLVSTKHFVNDSTPVAFPLGRIVVTPDGRRLVAGSDFSGVNLLMYDLQQRDFLDYHEYGADNRFMVGLSIQQQP